MTVKDQPTQQSNARQRGAFAVQLEKMHPMHTLGVDDVTFVIRPLLPMSKRRESYGEENGG